MIPKIRVTDSKNSKFLVVGVCKLKSLFNKLYFQSIVIKSNEKCTAQRGTFGIPKTTTPLTFQMIKEFFCQILINLIKILSKYKSCGNHLVNFVH